MKTREDVQELKRQWRMDGCWELETTDGFEDYHDELKAYRETVDAEWKRKRAAYYQEKAARFGCSIALAKFLDSLQLRITQLENMQERD